MSTRTNVSANIFPPSFPTGFGDDFRTAVSRLPFMEDKEAPWNAVAPENFIVEAIDFSGDDHFPYDMSPLEDISSFPHEFSTAEVERIMENMHPPAAGCSGDEVFWTNSDDELYDEIWNAFGRDESTDESTDKSTDEDEDEDETAFKVVKRHRHPTETKNEPRVKRIRRSEWRTSSDEDTDDEDEDEPPVKNSRIDLTKREQLKEGYIDLSMTSSEDVSSESEGDEKDLRRHFRNDWNGDYAYILPRPTKSVHPLMLKSI
jgi:hypothetical protein